MPDPSSFPFNIFNLFRKKPPSDDVRDGDELAQHYIDISEHSSSGNDEITDHEKSLLANILKLRDINVVDIMVPRADIVAVDADCEPGELMNVLAENQASRLPVYENNLDHVLGSIHIKDVLACLAQDKLCAVRDHLIDVPIVSPAMPVLDLILEMRMSRRHMALVVDEHGGIDGLVTLNDIIEEIVGTIDDEHDSDEPMMKACDDGGVIADGRLDIATFESVYGTLLSPDERDEIETIGGLVYTIAGRIPKRGEVLTHQSTGMIFEVLDADPRRVQRLRIRNIPKR